MADIDIRRAAFAWLSEQSAAHGGVMPRALLARGLDFRGQRVPLVSPQGIFRPQGMSYPLTITTVADGPYRDAFGPDGLLSYKYRGTDIGHRDNRGLREAMVDRIPLIYFHGLVPGSYLAAWPVYVVGDDRAGLSFSVAVDDQESLMALGQAGVLADSDETVAIRRGYVTTLVKRRIHQQAFRERVIAAYHQQCALCHLKHRELLDAAHIVPDNDPEGEPEVTNGISLCKLHHAAFDSFFLSVTPDYVIELRPSLLAETDGPMLKHGLQGMHGQRIVLPPSTALRPDRDRLAKRHKAFGEAIRGSR